MEAACCGLRTTTGGTVRMQNDDPTHYVMYVADDLLTTNIIVRMRRAGCDQPERNISVGDHSEFNLCGRPYCYCGIYRICANSWLLMVRIPMFDRRSGAAQKAVAYHFRQNTCTLFRFET